MIWWLFQKETPEQKAEAELQKASIQSLVTGGLPLRAQERIQRYKDHGAKTFTSDLSCNEFLLTEEAGYEPVSQVMGSAFMNISLWGTFVGGRTTGEMTDRTNALLEGREKALSRMKLEAESLGAHGVIGVDLRVKNCEWDGRLIEVTAIGTAIRIPGRQKPEHAFTSHLSAQEFWLLYEAGYWPVSLVMGVSAFYVFTDPSTRKTMRNWWGGNNNNNAEIPLYTQSFNDAYNRAIARICLQAEEFHGEGIVGSNVNHKIEDIEYERNDVTYNDLLITINAIGTAVQLDRQPREKRKHQPLMMIDLKRGGRRSFGFAEQNFSADLLSQEDDDSFDDE